MPIPVASYKAFTRSPAFRAAASCCRSAETKSSASHTVAAATCIALAARTAEVSSTVTVAAITFGVNSTTAASPMSSRRCRLIRSYCSRFSRRSRSRRVTAERISGTHNTHNASSEADRQGDSTASLPGSSMYRLANAEESKSVFTVTLFEYGRRQGCSLRRQAQARTPPRWRPRTPGRHGMNLGDRFAVAEHDQRLSPFDRIEQRRRTTAEISERNRFHGRMLQEVSHMRAASNQRLYRTAQIRSRSRNTVT